MTAAVAVRERPILFSAPMIRALLAGTKTQTRRVMAPQPPDGAIASEVKDGSCWIQRFLGDTNPIGAICPYGVVGDRLWVRETWAARGRHTDGHSASEIACNRSHFEVWYREQCYDGSREKFNTDFLGRWRPSIHMPRALSRITLEITNVGVERVQSISRDGAMAEGIDEYGHDLTTEAARDVRRNRSAIENFRALWDSLNASRGFAWESNPFVWVLTFKRIASEAGQVAA